MTSNYNNPAALHKEGAYTHLMNEEDVENLKWLKIFKYASILISIDTLRLMFNGNMPLIT